MSFPESLQSEFNKWADHESWHTSHDSDKERLYNFVWAAINHPGFLLKEEEIHQQLISKWSQKIHEDSLDEMAHKATSLARELFDFGHARPD